MIKVGDVVEIIIYDGVEATGKVVKVENFGSHEKGILVIQEANGDYSSPWSATEACVRLLTPLERLL